jgi:hypothetical protein
MSLTPLEIVTVRHSALEAAERLARASDGHKSTVDVLRDARTIYDFLLTGAPAAIAEMRIDGETFELSAASHSLDVSCGAGGVGGKVSSRAARLFGHGTPIGEGASTLAQETAAGLQNNPSEKKSADGAAKDGSGPAGSLDGLSLDRLSALGSLVEMHTNFDVAGGTEMIMDVPPGHVGILIQTRSAA